MARTISTTIAGTYTLQSQYTTISSAGAVTAISGNAVVGTYVNSTYGWTVTNSGTIAAPDLRNPVSVRGVGIYLHGAGDHVTNTTSGVIAGDVGVEIANAGAQVANYGTIGPIYTRSGEQFAVSAFGVQLDHGGNVTNHSSATIAAYFGIYAKGDPATVTNTGTILGFRAADGVNLRAGGEVINQAGGTIAGVYEPSEYGVDIHGGAGTVINAGYITGSFASVKFAAGYNNLFVAEPGSSEGLVNGSNTIGASHVSTLELASGASAGTIEVDSPHYGLGPFTFPNFAQTTIDARASWVIGASTVVAGSTLTALSGASLTDVSSLENDGTIALNAATLTVATLSGTGSVTIGSDGTLNAQGSVLASQAITMSGTGDVFVLSSPSEFAGVVTGFGTTGLIDVQGIGLARSATNNGDALNLYSGLGGSGTLLFSFPDITGAGGAILNPAKLHFSADDAGGTVIACYLRGTRVRTARGEVAIEDLAIGDPVVTLSGALQPARWIGRRRYVLATTDGHDAVLPVLIRRGAISDGLPRRDLCVSPEHALFLDGALVPARHLVNGSSIIRCNDLTVLDYIHIELAKHDVIFAEGQPAETFVDCDSRAMFDNPATYTGGGSPPWIFCAPRVEDGEWLADLRHHLAVRAGIACGDWRDGAPGPLIGNLERIGEGFVEGWAQDASAPERPVCLEILADGAIVGRVVANRHRDDLAVAGLGSGRHAFRAPLPTAQVHRIEVRRGADSAVLPGSPKKGVVLSPANSQ